MLAIDLGGTKITAAVVAPPGKIIAKEYYPTLASEGPPGVIDRILIATERALGTARVASIGIGAAGAIDSEGGLVLFSPNLPGWHDVSLGNLVRQKFGLPVYLINDAKAAALGEHRLGAGRSVDNLIVMTVGTGIGGGIIIGGKLYVGASGTAGEIGHMTIDVNGPKCNCGNTGCLETLASGSAIAREARARLSQGEASSLRQMVGGRLEEVTAKEVSLAAQGGDTLAREVIDKAATYLGVGMTNLVNALNPQMIIVGGGVSQMGELLLGPARWVVKERAFSVAARAVRIVKAELGEDAGLLGAAIFASLRGMC